MNRVGKIMYQSSNPSTFIDAFSHATNRDTGKIFKLK